MKAFSAREGPPIVSPALRCEPDLAAAHANLGLALQAKRVLDGAIAEYRTAIRIQPDLAVAHTNLGVALDAMGDLNGAVAEYRAAIRLQPNHTGARRNLDIAFMPLPFASRRPRR